MTCIVVCAVTEPDCVVRSPEVLMLTPVVFVVLPRVQFTELVTTAVPLAVATNCWLLPAVIDGLVGVTTIDVMFPIVTFTATEEEVTVPTCAVIFAVQLLVTT